jgi:hypothetical protein
MIAVSEHLSVQKCLPVYIWRGDVAGGNVNMGKKGKAYPLCAIYWRIGGEEV